MSAFGHDARSTASARAAAATTAPDGAVDERTYYGRPVIKEPVWTWEVPTYFFTGGIAGASAVLAVIARFAGRPRLARAARVSGAVAAAISPPLLVSDLGRPARFLNMLRVFKPTSPLSMGSWLLSVFAPAAMASAALDTRGRSPRLQRVAESGAALTGSAMTTYTAVLVTDTAVPVWHQARRELPFVFAGSALAGAGALAALLVDGDDARAAAAVAAAGGATEGAALALMEHRLGAVARPYREGRSGTLARLAKTLSTSGAAALALSGDRTGVRRVGAALSLAGSLALRWAVFEAGRASARDPLATIVPQRARL